MLHTPIQRRNISCLLYAQLEFFPRFGFFSFTDVNVLYSASAVTLSAGYLIMMLFCVPMSMLNLDDNVKVVQVKLVT